MRELSEIRKDIDRIDEEIRELLMQRLDCSEEVVQAKICDQNYVIYRGDREKSMLERLGSKVPEKRREGYLAVVRKVTETSRMYQYGFLFEQVPELFEELTGEIDLKTPTDLVTVYLERADVPNSMSAILSMIGDYGFDMEQMRLDGYSGDHRAAKFELTIRGDITLERMQKLLLQLAMESENFRILSCR